MTPKRAYLAIVNRTLTRPPPRVYEQHHLWPKCMWRQRFFMNIPRTKTAKVTLQEHFRCHQLLTEVYPEHKGLVHALWRMSTRKGIKISAEEYERLKKVVLPLQRANGRANVES